MSEAGRQENFAVSTPQQFSNDYYAHCNTCLLLLMAVYPREIRDEPVFSYMDHAGSNGIYSRGMVRV